MKHNKGLMVVHSEREARLVIQAMVAIYLIAMGEPATALCGGLVLALILPWKWAVDTAAWLGSGVKDMFTEKPEQSLSITSPAREPANE